MKLFHIDKKRNLIISYILVVIFTLSVVYLTPLKNSAIIEPTIHDVDPSAFVAEYKNNTNGYIFIDVRDVNSYNNLRAKGSISMPLHTLYDQRKNLPKTGKKIVLICSGGRASGVGYMYLQHYGYFNIARI